MRGGCGRTRRFLGVSHEAAALSLAKEWNAAEAERAAETPRLAWEPSRGGTGGPCLILKLGEHYVGHFYSDPGDQIDGAALVAEMAEAWNATSRPAPKRDDAAFLAFLGIRRVPNEPGEGERFEVSASADSFRYGA